MQTIKTRMRPDRSPITRKIIATDSEGWNIPLTPGITSANPNVAKQGWHSDVMIAAADDSGKAKTLVHDGSRREANDLQARNYGLPTEDACEFLLDLPQDAIVVGFYFSYDTTKLFADLPLENMRELSNDTLIPQDEYERRVRAISDQYGLSLDYVHKAKLVDTTSTVYNGYLIKYTPRKQLTIIDLESGRSMFTDMWRDAKTGRIFKARKAESDWNRKVTVWDVYGFFQKPFAGALSDYRCGQCAACKEKPQRHCETAIWSESDLERIKYMKAERGEFTPERSAEIEQYCIDECRYLSFLVRDLLTHIDNFGLQLSRFDGSGAIAAAWMKQNHIKDFMPIRTDGAEPGDFYLSGLPEIVALSAYFGGRFEISEIGFMGYLYSYDINSAYPHVCRNLPCLAHGHFERVTEYMPDRLGVYLAGSQTSGNWAPFPFRTEPEPVPGMAKDAIYYCHGGRRWVWQDELKAAREHFGSDAIPVYDGWIWVPECDHKPFAAIGEMYDLRKEFVREGNGVEKVIKLILNSLYGKTAQSLGWTIKNGESKPPPFQCFIWAGMITSGCRAMILDAIKQESADVVSIATDGILSRSPIPELDAPKEKLLGKWEADTVSDGYLFQSGVYTYVKESGKRSYKTRGFSAREISADKLIDAWRNDVITVHANPEESRFIPMKSGVLRENALEYVGQWVPSEHDVSFTHNRRLPMLDYSGDDLDTSGIIRNSEPHYVTDDVMSAPYTPKQTWEDIIENQPVPADVDHMEISEPRI